MAFLILIQLWVLRIKMLTKEEIVLKLQRNELELKKKFHVEKLYLFGSYARDEQTESSDIDILVEFSNEFKDDFSNELDFQVFLYNLFEKDIGLIQKDEVTQNFKDYILHGHKKIEVC